MRPRPRNPTLIEVFDGGIMGTLCGYWGIDDQNLPPWSDTSLNEVSYDKIDKLLFTNYGDRPVNRYVLYYLGDDDVLSGTAAKIISTYVLDMCRDQWARLTAAYTAEYDPIENYSLAEHEDGTNTASGTDTSTDSYDDYTETQKQGHTVTTQTDTGLYGANSATAVDADTGTTETTFGAAGDTGDKLTITGTKSNDFTHGKVDTFERDFTRHGNIGVLTATQMITADAEFWSSHNFFDQICADIAALLTIPIYE